MDRDKVLNALNICRNVLSADDCNGCPYQNDYAGFARHDTGKTSCVSRLMEDALDLLKEQEAVQTYKDDNGFSHCSACDSPQSYGCKYCDNCGKPLKWELI